MIVSFRIDRGVNLRRAAERGRQIRSDRRQERVKIRIAAKRRDEAFDAIADFLGRSHGLDAQQVRVGVTEREALGSTGLGRGVAIPHARVKGLQRAVAVVARLGTPIAFDAPDRKPVSDMLALRHLAAIFSGLSATRSTPD
jgi:PTS system nitrogen regulatory IIA component